MDRLRRARAVRPGFELTDGNAAAVARSPSGWTACPGDRAGGHPHQRPHPEQILPRLRQRLAILTSDAQTLPERQRTLRGAIAEARELFRAVDSPMGILTVVLGLSYLARWEDRYEDAVRLAGAAASLRERVGGRAPLDFLAGFLGDREAEARARLPEDAARRAFQEGRAMSVEAALAPAPEPA